MTINYHKNSVNEWESVRLSKYSKQNLKKIVQMIQYYK